MTALFALFIRSLREDWRSRLPHIFRLGLIVIILLIIWANQRSFGSRSAPGREFFGMIMMLNLGFIALAALSIFPAAIAEEKEDETLPLLRMTNLSSLSILFGKSTSRMLSALLLLAVQVPFTLLAITLGGVSMQQIWGSYAILGATIFFLCNLALLASVYCRTTIRAGFLTAILGAVVYCALPFIAVISTGMFKAPPWAFNPVSTWDQIAQTLVQGNPMFALIMYMERPSALGGGLTAVWFGLIAGVVCFLLAWLLFDRCCGQPAETQRRVKKSAGGKIRFNPWRPSRSWFRWPLAWKDFHFMIGGWKGFVWRLLLCAVVYGGAYGIAYWEHSDRLARYAQYDSGYSAAELRMRFLANVGAGVTVISGLCAALELVLVAGRVFGAERRRLTLSSLVGLPWSVGKIVRQKIAGILPVLAPWLILAFVGVMHAPDEFWKEAASELRNLSISWRRNREEISIMLYVVLQAFLLLATIVWFSLRLRRGGLPAAITVITIWNILFGVFVEDLPNRDEYIGLLIGVFLTLPALLFMSLAVRNRIQLAAAED